MTSHPARYDEGMDERTALGLLDLAEELAPRLTGPDASESIARLDARGDDLRGALEWFVDQGRDDDALRLANALYRYWITQRRFDEGGRWFDRALASAAGESRLRGRAYVNAGFMPFWLGDDERAAALFGESLEIGRQDRKSVV